MAGISDCRFCNCSFCCWMIISRCCKLSVKSSTSSDKSGGHDTGVVGFDLVNSDIYDLSLYRICQRKKDG